MLILRYKSTTRQLWGCLKVCRLGPWWTLAAGLTYTYFIIVFDNKTLKNMQPRTLQMYGRPFRTTKDHVLHVGHTILLFALWQKYNTCFKMATLVYSENIANTRTIYSSLASVQTLWREKMVNFKPMTSLISNWNFT